MRPIFMAFAAAFGAGLLLAVQPAASDDAPAEDVAGLMQCLEGDHPISPYESCVHLVYFRCFYVDGAPREGEEGPCLAREVAAWDAILNAEYAAMRALLPDAERDLLRSAQLAWIEMRGRTCQLAARLAARKPVEPRYDAGTDCLRVETMRRAIDLFLLRRDLAGR